MTEDEREELREKLYDEAEQDERLHVCENCTDYLTCDFCTKGYSCDAFDWEDYRLHEIVNERIKKEFEKGD